MAVVSGLTAIVAIGKPVQAETLTVGADNSLKAPLQEILPIFEKEYGVTVHVEYGPSNMLRRQIEQGAPIDVFLSAAEDIETLQKKGLTPNGGLQTYAQTSLVLIMSTTSHALEVSFHDALANRTTRVALRDPQTSSLGSVTARVLTNLDPAYKNRLNLLYAQDNEDLVNLVHIGKADVGIVYRVDAIHKSGQVRIIDEPPAGTYTPVRFGEAVVWTCRQTSQTVAKGFVDFMASPRIQKLLLKYGFDPIPSAKQ